MPLSASQRITLLKEISRRLESEEWPLVDVTLSQFGLPISDSWNGDKSAYVLQMSKGATDSVLVELAQHVGFVLFDEAPKQGIDPPFWRKGMLRVFLSHLSAHRETAAQIQEALLAYGISGFVAHNDIEPTAEWQAQIETALATADSLVALLHPDFHTSKWTDQEIGYAMGRGIPVFSVRFGQDPHGFIGRFQAFGGIGKAAPALGRELFEAFRKNKQTQRRMGEVLVGLFEQSDTYASAKQRMGYLEELEFWDPGFAPRVRAAAKSNSQIIGSWGVKDRVAALEKKWAASG